MTYEYEGKTKKEEIEQIPTVIFGDYVFEDVD